jgi:hypothetical protein
MGFLPAVVVASCWHGCPVVGPRNKCRHPTIDCRMGRRGHLGFTNHERATRVPGQVVVLRSRRQFMATSYEPPPTLYKSTPTSLAILENTFRRCQPHFCWLLSNSQRWSRVRIVVMAVQRELVTLYLWLCFMLRHSGVTQVATHSSHCGFPPWVPQWRCNATPCGCRAGLEPGTRPHHCDESV